MRVGETILTFAVSNYVSLLFCVKVVIYKIYMYGVVSHFDLLHTYVLLEMQVKYY